MLPSPRALKYCEALEREGDAFNYDAWLKRVREEEARERGEIQVPRPSANVAGLKVPARDAGSPNFTNPLFGGRVLPTRSKNAARETPGDSMRERLLKVCDAWDELQEDRSRDAVYPYLRRVYAIVRRYRGRRETRELLRSATKIAGLPYDRYADPFATIIRCTCEQKLDPKAISKWSRALRYTAHRDRPPRLLIEFIKSLGGISACANRYAKRLGAGATRKRPSGVFVAGAKAPSLAVRTY